MGRSALLALILAASLLLLNKSLGTPRPFGFPVVFALVYLTLGALVRMALLQFLLFIYRRDVPSTRVLIYGAGTTGMQLAMALKSHESIQAVAFIDDNISLHNITVAGLPVYPPKALAQLIEKLSIDRILLAMPSLSAPRRAQVARRFADLGVDVHSLPSFAQLVGKEAIIDNLAPVLPNEFLGRNHLHASMRSKHAAYRGRSVLITGAGGSIGSELCRQILSCGPARLVLMDISEFALYSVHRELAALLEGKDCTIVPVLASVTDARAVRSVIEKNGVSVVLHTAAYKHVPLVEDNPEAGITNNVFGTQVVAQQALDCEVDRFILVSTDKAVRPNGLMGASKRLAEMLVSEFARSSRHTIFTMVRFGNVLGSSGSVIPLFHDQIQHGGPVTLTHPEMTRYFMTVQEATQLVLTAGELACGGEIFVLDMGKPVLIADLARRVIEASGYTVRDAQNPNGDIEIVTIGLRPGEKLSEELSTWGILEPTAHPKILRSIEGALGEFQITRAMQSLRGMIDRGETDLLAGEAMRWVNRDLEAAPKQTIVQDLTKA